MLNADHCRVKKMGGVSRQPAIPAQPAGALLRTADSDVGLIRGFGRVAAQAVVARSPMNGAEGSLVALGPAVNGGPKTAGAGKSRERLLCCGGLALVRGGDGSCARGRRPCDGTLAALHDYAALRKKARRAIRALGELRRGGRRLWARSEAPTISPCDSRPYQYCFEDRYDG